MNIREITYLKTQIIDLAKIIDSNYYEYQILSTEGEYYHQEEASDILRFIHICIQRLYKAICVYLEDEDLKSYLESFKEKFKNRVEDFKEITIGLEMPEDSDSLVSLPIASDIKSFLSPFIFFSTAKSDSTEYDRLLNILKSTSQILAKTKEDKSSEAPIYNEVAWVLDFYFKVRRGFPTGFRGKFGSYRPDILIPEVFTAIEYKYVREKALLNPHLDALRSDANNYTGDYEYNYFVAVICFEKLLFTEENIRTAWDEKIFPSNWELVIVAL
jgi:hypothetical protein